MPYVSTSPLFKSLSDADVLIFQQAARNRAPPDGAAWSVLHPVCRLVWIKRAAATEPETLDALLLALERLVERCDGDEGVRPDGSNIDTQAAHIAMLRVIAAMRPSSP